ncbi:hypothetical protein AKJ09_05932 [Labilithrix luteola]|uniref:Uncharacterized protein n=1 Tax=Labilithrix luteola TaxID=1391654 RepID=A0A0K1Q0G8_9BACT|nr:hypothetical protein [Labilithrix luteola]AKU99268.1 hypothetical protein AKJ09_05932 [Labilithrix luteola]
MASSFDASAYDTIPQTGAAGSLALVRSLISAAQPDASPAAKKALKRARAKAETLRTLFSAAAPQKVASVTRVADTNMDRAWSALEQYLGAFADLDDDFHPHAREARELHAVLFPNGTAFLKLPYAEQWAEGDALLSRLEAGDSERAIAKLGGKSFVDQVKTRHAEYGEALGVTKAKAAAADTASLAEPLREVQLAVAVYARVLSAAVQNEELDPNVAVQALAPIAALRVRLKERKKGGAPAEDGASPDPVSPEPLPPVT